MRRNVCDRLRSLLRTILGHGRENTRGESRTAAAQSTTTSPVEAGMRPGLPRPLKTQVRPATVVCADLVAYSSFDSQSDAIARECISLLEGIARRHGASVDHRVGDTIMAVFEDVGEIRNAPRAAIEAAIEMRRELMRFNERYSLARPLNIHMGVETGPVISGETTGPLGETPNIAARLMSWAPIGEICVGATTWQSVRHLFDFEPVAVLEMKGTGRPVRAFAVRSTGEKAQSWGAESDGREMTHATAAQGPAEISPELVLLGASAPRQCEPGGSFTAVLVVYVEAMRDSAQRKLTALGEEDHRVVTDVAAGQQPRLRVGAPVSVNLRGEHLQVTPPHHRFEWNGRENLAAFSVRVDDGAPTSSIELCFDVSVADVPIAFIPLRLEIVAHRAATIPNQVHSRTPNSAFASYSSMDSEPVGGRLSTLRRWAPGLDIFQDCLDLAANEAFKPRLEEEIRRRDVFLLFWSRHAAASPWVQWEYRTAQDAKGIDAILPMPLEDPEIAPPPPEFAGRHLRDRFMLAGFALAKIREEATKGRL